MVRWEQNKDKNIFLSYLISDSGFKNGKKTTI